MTESDLSTYFCDNCLEQTVHILEKIECNLLFLKCTVCGEKSYVDIRREEDDNDSN